MASAEKRFWAKVQKTDTCWLWTGNTINSGYGRFSLTHNHSVLAHRYAWELANGPIPDGMCVLHTCDNPPCCNLAHLFLGTKADNNTDMIAKGRHGQSKKTHCPASHPLLGENLYITPGGHRRCRKCDRKNRRNRYLQEVASWK